MKLKIHKDVHGFYQETYDLLMRHEAQNMILLGNMIIGHKGQDKTDWRDPSQWLMMTVSDDVSVKLIALMTPPHHITLYAVDNVIDHQSVRVLVEGLKDYKIPGVTSDQALATCFADEYSRQYGSRDQVVMNQRIYELTSVNPEVNPMGTMRLIEEKDMHYFPYWAEAFNAAGQYGSTEMSIPQQDQPYLYRIASKKFYVLEVNGIPVSMAGFTREMQTAIGVAFVYTPPYFRGKGYASSCVAQLSQMALDRGFSKCVLYTDLLNPTSNHIYQKIGYKPVCDSLMLKFTT